MGLLEVGEHIQGYTHHTRSITRVHVCSRCFEHKCAWWKLGCNDTIHIAGVVYPETICVYHSNTTHT